MRTIAIVTGASSGLGKEFVSQIDQKEKTDEIWVIARRRQRLEEMQEGLKTPLRIIDRDLIEKQSIVDLKEMLKKEKPVVKLLINAAGYGRIGGYNDIPLEDCDKMIELNCRAAVDMTQICLPYMKKGSRIMEICSTAAFQPFQYLNIYAASKAFLYRYTRALRVELCGRGIHVTAVCPYWIKDTEFIGTAKQTEKSGYIHAYPLSSKRKNVVHRAFRDSRLNLAVSTPGVVCSLHRAAAKIIPNSLLMAVWELLRKI